MESMNEQRHEHVAGNGQKTLHTFQSISIVPTQHDSLKEAQESFVTGYRHLVFATWNISVFHFNLKSHTRVHPLKFILDYSTANASSSISMQLS